MPVQGNRVEADNHFFFKKRSKKLLCSRRYIRKDKLALARGLLRLRRNS
jgi:hypothetical protein